MSLSLFLCLPLSCRYTEHVSFLILPHASLDPQFFTDPNFT
jgi:hypothetical protein